MSENSKGCIDHCRPVEAGAVQGTVRYSTLVASSDAWSGGFEKYRISCIFYLHVFSESASAS